MNFSAGRATNDTQAVVFFEGEDFTREILYTEFEAILDGVVGVNEYASTEMRAAYVHINARLQITAAVFFLISFDKTGFADRDWNVPLVHLAQTAGPGPDLGGGKTHFSCRSQCSVPWHQHQLWDPTMEGVGNDLVVLIEAIRANRLGLMRLGKPKDAVEDDFGQEIPLISDAYEGELDDAGPSVIETAPIPVLKPAAPVDISDQIKAVEKQITERLTRQFQKLHRDKMAEQAKEHQLTVKAMQGQRVEEMAQLKQQNKEMLQEYMESIEELESSLSIEKKHSQQLKQQFSEQAREFEAIREQYEMAEELEDNVEFDLLKQQMEVEFQAKLEAQLITLKEKLEMREIELFYRNEQESNLRQEVAQILEEKLQLLNEGADQYVERLHNSGITFVTYHSGPGHMTIPKNEVGRYLDNPTAYAAEKCFISERHYRDWLTHFEHPLCEFVDDQGQRCEMSLACVAIPADYVPNESCYCDAHRQQAMQKAQSAFD